MRINTKLAGTGGIALDGARMYVFDPSRGRRRRHLLRDQVVAGLALLARGATNQKTVTIEAPPARVYAFLTEWEQWPQWMSHVREVTPRGTVDGCDRTHWVVDGRPPHRAGVLD